MNTVKLLVISEYISRGERYPEGKVLEVDEARAAFLLRDAPGCFERVEDAPIHTEIDAPPVDKMVRRARRK
jgi:hypothetical protein